MMSERRLPIGRRVANRRSALKACVKSSRPFCRAEWQRGRLGVLLLRITKLPASFKNLSLMKSYGVYRQYSMGTLLKKLRLIFTLVYLLNFLKQSI